MLIVDDNRDMRERLKESFEAQYNLRLAVDGIAGFKIALECLPDLVITDLMMPNKDGIELCRDIKENEATCHIPVILLTAKDTVQDRINGLEFGADDYVGKPFNTSELKARVFNLIKQRRMIRERFSHEIFLEPSHISVTSADEAFLTQAIAVVESHAKDESFSLDFFRDEMNMSRSTLFRRLSELTGQTPTEFIRIIRLKMAAKLLEKNFGNISQVALEVGFNNISYFNRSFKKLFGVSPKEYARK